ncbi:MAG TPA: low molecular weight protein arginine phosphatase [Gemmatimonadaceae bacterium]|nr:low molecular weight protein arginine phosphatase [Gemmatimonadaceae bacterium]
MKILFVCSGNTCRSPLAAAIAKSLLDDAGRTDVDVSSAGTQAWEGSPASDGALLVGMERNLDLSGHRSRALTENIVKESDLILAMSTAHLSRVKELDPQARVHLLAGFTAGDNSGRSIQDPFGGDLADYRETADDLEEELAGLLERIGAT